MRRGSSTQELPGGVWLVPGDPSLRGVTRPVVPTVRFGGTSVQADGGVRIAFHANGPIRRRDFGLTHEPANEAGGLPAGRDIAIDIDVEASGGPR